jgi:omega-6 fatty acid desaturase (delta-12 desaturase)
VAFWQLANTLVPYGVLWALAFWCVGHAPWLLVPVLPLIVLFLCRCFSLMHDCGHGSLFRTRRCNRWAGFLLGIVCAIPQLPWSRGHAYHHRHNGDWEKYQGPSALISTAAYAELSPGQQRRYRWLRHPLMLLPGGFFYLVLKPRLTLILGLWDFFSGAVRPLSSADRGPLSSRWHTYLSTHRNRHWHSHDQFVDLLANNLVVVVLWLVLGAWVGPTSFWTLYGPVMTCAAAIFICIFFVQHNFPGSYAHRTEGWSGLAGALQGTSDLELHAALNWFTADIGCHSIHHLCAAIPNYHLRECSERNRDRLSRVTRLSLADIPRCFDYILWDPDSARLSTVAMQRPG